MNEAASASRHRLSRLLEPHRPHLALVLLALCLYLPSVWNRDVWSPDEPRYAEVAREMVARGDYFLPHLNGEVYGEKPPLFFWLGILAGRLPGVPFEAGTRLVSALAALGSLMLTFRLGRRLADARTGWLAALVLATSSMFVLHATSGVIDGTLAFLVVAAISVGLDARSSGSPVAWAGFYALAGLAILTKGPVGFLIPAGVLLLLVLAEQGWRRMGAWHPLWGLGLAIGIVSLWLVPAIIRGGAGYAEIILFKQNVGRAYESWHHKEPMHYFLAVFPASFLPWVVLLPTALYGAVRAARRDRLSRLALIWFVFTFVFFSLVSGKKTRYLLPLFPAASLMVGLELRRLFARAGEAIGRLRGGIPLVAGAVVLGGAGLAIAALPLVGAARLFERLQGLAPDQREALSWFLGAPGASTLVAPGLAIAGLCVAGLAAMRRDRERAFACSTAAALLLFGWAQWVGTPALDTIKSARPMAEAVARAAGPDATIVMYRESWAGILNVALRRETIPELSGADRIAGFLDENPGAVVLAAPEDLDRLRLTLPALRTIECRRLGEQGICAARAETGPR